MVQALNGYHIEGIFTNIDFANQVLTHPVFIKGELSTDFIPTYLLDRKKQNRTAGRGGKRHGHRHHPDLSPAGKPGSELAPAIKGQSRCVLIRQRPVTTMSPNAKKIFFLFGWKIKTTICTGTCSSQRDSLSGYHPTNGILPAPTETEYQR